MKITQDVTIIDFIRHPLILNDQTMSPSQASFLKSIYGLPLDDVELEIYLRGTGRETYIPREQREATLLGGRRGGKTGKLGARIAMYEAFRYTRNPRGERRFVMLIAPVIAQAKLAFDFILGEILNSPILRSKIAKVGRNEIELKNGIVIGCYACSLITVRGRAAVAIICDEICFWRNEVTSVHNDEEVLAALRPSTATFPTSKIIKISTPNVKRGVVYDEFQRRAVLDHHVWQLSTQELNPTISNEFLEAERKRNPEDFKREYLAQFVDSVVSWIEPEVLARCVIKGRMELPPLSSATYAAAIDPAFKHSDFAMAIAHQADRDLIVLDRVPFWTGSKRAPLGFQWVCGQVAGILGQYGLNVLKGDQFAAVAIKQEFMKLGISYGEVTFGRNTRGQLFNNLLHVIEQQQIELLDHPELLRQLRSLEVHRSSDGNIDVRPADGQKDDLAVVLALCVLELSQSANNFAPIPISLGHVTRSWEGQLPNAGRRWDGFSVCQLDCAKFPKCWDNGHCECGGF
jgi:Terminase large subunit, T4likevirus-type, N-terminal